jgi:hypothetical protein
VRFCLRTSWKAEGKSLPAIGHVIFLQHLRENLDLTVADFLRKRNFLFWNFDDNTLNVANFCGTFPVDESNRGSMDFSRAGK